MSYKVHTHSTYTLYGLFYFIHIYLTIHYSFFFIDSCEDLDEYTWKDYSKAQFFYDDVIIAEVCVFCGTS